MAFLTLGILMCLIQKDTATTFLNVQARFKCSGPVLPPSLSELLRSNRFLAESLVSLFVCMDMLVCVNVFEIEMWLYDIQACGSMRVA